MEKTNNTNEQPEGSSPIYTESEYTLHEHLREQKEWAMRVSSYYESLCKRYRTTFVILIILLSASSVVLYSLYSNRKKYGKFLTANDAVFSVMDHCIESGQPLSLEYISNIKESVERTQARSVPMINLLQDYLIHLSTATPTSKKPSADADSIAEQIQVFIKSEREQEPFANLPDNERRLFRAIKDAVTNKDDDAIDFNINELSTAVNISHRTHNEAIRGSRVKANVGIAIGVIGIIVALGTTLYSSSMGNKIDRVLTRTELNASMANMLADKPITTEPTAPKPSD